MIWFTIFTLFNSILNQNEQSEFVIVRTLWYKMRLNHNNNNILYTVSMSIWKVIPNSAIVYINANLLLLY